MSKGNLQFEYDQLDKKVCLQELTTNQLLDFYEQKVIHHVCSGVYTTKLERELDITPIRLELRRRCGMDFEQGGKGLCVKE